MTESQDSIAVTPIGTVRSERTAVVDDEWGSVESTIELDDRFDSDALSGLDAFSHAEVVFVMNRVDPETVETGSRRPRNNPEWPEVGIFAQRAKRRPNRIGVSRCSVGSVDGRIVTVRGLDAVDGTPVLDLKPYLCEFGPRGAVDQSTWSSELMERYFD